jgi:hypothetical protein
MGLGIADPVTLKGLYGQTRGDWKPFGSDVTIDAILGTVLGQLNQNVQPAQFEWDPVDFLAVGGDWNAELARLAGPSVVLMDPLSLYHPRIKDRVQLLTQYFDKGDLVFVMLAPFCVAPPYDVLRTMVRVLAAPLLDSYFDPTPRKLGMAACAVGICDHVDLARAIRAALLRGAVQPAPESHPFLGAPKRA